ncbi:hypothetical protein KAJ83_12630 [Marivibrio halodurans]|uniref:PAS domain-containing protein n=2 Tax=Marivibrio halodurans TaxID=2039722 RepID=A0A8J7S9D2_9PROT|nr:hypothetical protein [Marivibrio halodurans]
MPAWSDFDIADFVGWHRHIILHEVTGPPFDLYCRLFGTFPTEAYGVNLTGRTVRNAAPRIETANDLAHLEKLATEQRIGCCSGTRYWSGKEFITMAFLELPLSDDGQAVTHFLILTVDLPPAARAAHATVR